MSEDDYRPGWVGLTAEWPVQVLAGLLEAMTARLEEVSEGAICDHCLLVFPVQSLPKSILHFAAEVNHDTDSVLGQAVLTNVCSQCYRAAQKEAAMQRLAPLFDGMRGSMTTFDLSSLLGGEPVSETSDDRMPGQYL